MRPWWRTAVGYQVYLRSFQDTDGDGVGDLPGVTRRLGYLADLGVDVVWVTPFYPSPQADHGYDVADYTGVDPAFGGPADVDELVSEAHRLGLRLVIDLVPNHTSDRHPWFVEARGSRDAVRRDWYVWRDPAPDGGPPNNWVSHFGGPAWTFDDVTGQYYLHLFLPEQPDLDWANEEVRRAFDRILAFWFDRGVDGLRIDVAHALVKDPELRDNPLVAEAPPADASPQAVFAAYDHRHDMDQSEVLDVYRRWHRIARRYDALLLGEVYLLEPERLRRYVADRDGLDLAFCFPVLKVGWDPAAIRDVLVRSVAAGGDALAWPLSSHDDPRAATRFGGGTRGARRALAYLGLLCGLPGVPFLYQGDELGLEDGDVAETADPLAARNPGARGRDGSRTPIPWEPGEGRGFTSGRPWLAVGRNHGAALTVRAQQGVPDAHLERVRRLLAARRRLVRDHADDAVTWLDDRPDIVALRRSRLVVACHVGDGEAELALPAAGELGWASADDATVDGDRLRLPADATAYVVLHA